MSVNTPSTNDNQLKRQLNPMHVWAIAFGCVIGWGSFINPGKKFLPNSGVAGTAIAMVLGALVMIVIAFSYAYMVPKYPKDIYRGVSMVTFEGERMPAMAGYEQYLTMIFGDYMQLPPKEEQKPHHEIAYLDLNTPAGEYQKPVCEK